MTSHLPSSNNQKAHNSIMSLRLLAVLPELFEAEALEYLSYVVDNPSSPGITSSELTQAIDLAASSLLPKVCGDDHLQAARFLNMPPMPVTGTNCLPAYKRAQVVIPKLPAFVEVFVEYTGAEQHEARVIGRKRVERM